MPTLSYKAKNFTSYCNCSSPICFSVYAASSGVALGITPGSLKLVLNKADITNKNSNPPITGMAGVIRTAKYGQL